MIRIIEQYLKEDIDAVRNLQQFKDIPEDVFDKIIRIDPTFNEGSNSVGKYGKWLLVLYKKDPIFKGAIDAGGTIETQISASVKRLIDKYDNYKNDRTKVIEKDIMRFKTLQDMQDAVNNAGEAELSAKQSQRQAKKNKNYDLVFESDKYYVFVPKNHDGDMTLASFGGSSKAIWCTAADSDNGKWRYDYYLEQGGKYYVLINKNNYEDKYQFHFESRQFMDKNNDKIDLKDFFEKNTQLYEFFDDQGYLIEGYYGDEDTIPDDPEEQVGIIEEYFRNVGVEEITSREFYSACEYKEIFDDIVNDEGQNFYDEDSDEQFNMLKDVGLLEEYDSFEDVPEDKQDYLWEMRDEYEEAYRNMYDNDFRDWFQGIYGRWGSLDEETKEDLLQSFHIDAYDIAQGIVYEMEGGYDYCESILNAYRG